MAKQVVAGFVVAEEEYGEFLSLMEDRADLPDTYPEFVTNLDRKIAQLAAQGVAVRKVVVPMAKFRLLMVANKVKADKNGRAFAAAFIAMHEDRKG